MSALRDGPFHGERHKGNSLPRMLRVETPKLEEIDIMSPVLGDATGLIYRALWAHG